MTQKGYLLLKILKCSESFSLKFSQKKMNVTKFISKSLLQQMHIDFSIISTKFRLAKIFYFEQNDDQLGFEEFYCSL